MEKKFNDTFAFKGIYVSIQHIFNIETAFNLARKDDLYYCHAVTSRNDGLILRLVGLDSEWPGIEESLIRDGWNDIPHFIDFCRDAHAAGYEVIHFDRDQDLVEGAPWFDVDSETGYFPVGLGLDVLNYWELDDATREAVAEDYDYRGAELENDLFIQVGENIYNLSSDVLAEHGTDSPFGDLVQGSYQETAFSRLLFVMVEGEEYSANVYRQTA